MEVQLKSAREMFEELGFECRCKEQFQPSGELYHKEIKYLINGGTIKDLYFGYEITFILDNDNHNISKHYAHSVNVNGCGGYNFIDMPLLEAINKQIEELGWNK